ncbi:MAG: BREX-1 system adenine-specific DNA-methyltransferase PglX [Ruminococcus sp.]|nr:BREX-1 system adenine-specific DNA-methyltransferase PglX [Ruminococcus sp.]
MNKNAIKNFAVSARILLIQAVTQKAFEYEVTEDGKNDPSQAAVNGQSLTSAEQSQRAQLIAQIRAKGFASTMEEAAYTWFNRFIALRFMEVNNYLPSHTRIFSDEDGNFKPEVLTDAVNLEIDGLDKELVLELLEQQKNEQLYQYIIITQCNALNEGLPEMFERIGGWTELLFPKNLLREDSVIAHMVKDIPESDWNDQVQIIGWLYQYYNSEPKDKVFANLKKNIKISAADIPAATQLFTPDWIVRYMVENSLGRLWTEGHGKPENANWKYYLEEAEQEDAVKADLEKLRAAYREIQPEQIKIIDPCMGSGHILVYAFDVLMDIYTACGWSERDAAKSILRNNLYGLDIDRRAYQLAYFAVMMKARQYNRRILSAENQPNLANFADVMHVNTSLLSGSLRKFAEQFQFADTYGSLMTVTKPAGLDEAVSVFLPTFGMQAEQLEMMMRVAQILTQKYDVVCTNPPYMGGSGMNTTLSTYVKKNFPDSKSDLSTCFMEQCGRLATKNGYYAMINIPVWMFLSSYEKLRKKIEIRNTYVNMVHFGRGIFGSDFGTTSFVISKTHTNEYIGVYRRLFEKQGAVDSVEQKQKWFFEGMGYYTAKQENFSKIPGSPVAYWVSEKIFDCFANFEKIDDVANPRQGLATGNNEKFLRLWYEVSNEDIKFDAVSLDDFFETNRKYIPYNKGGSFRKWFANMEFIIRFDRKHYGILGTVGNHLPSRDFYFKESITWSKVTSGGLSMRYIPHGSAFDVAGCSIFCDRNIMYMLGFVNSCVMQNLMNVLSQTLNYEVGSVKQIPIIYKDVEKIESIVKENVSISKEDLVSYESHFEFEKHPLV